MYCELWNVPTESRISQVEEHNSELKTLNKIELVGRGSTGLHRHTMCTSFEQIGLFKCYTGGVQKSDLIYISMFFLKAGKLSEILIDFTIYVASLARKRARD